MSWSLLPAPIVKPRNPSQLPAVLSVSRVGGRYPQSCALTIRTRNIPEGVEREQLNWWDHDRRVTLQRGFNEHDGKIRIEPDLLGLWKLTGANGKGATPNPPRLLFVFPGMPQAGSTNRAVLLVIKNGWIEVTLPPWAKGQKP